MQTAETVIILADETYPAHSASTTDARSVMVALAVETLNRNVYTFAEVCQPENKQHFLNANVDEVLVADEIVADLMQSAKRAILVGIERAGQVLMNPTEPLVITSNDKLILISRRAVVLE